MLLYIANPAWTNHVNSRKHFLTRDVQNDVLTPPTTTPTQSICEEQPPTPTTTPIWPQFYHNLGVKLGVNWGYLTPIFINWHPQPNTNPIFGQKWPEIGDIHNWGPIFCSSLTPPKICFNLDSWNFKWLDLNKFLLHPMSNWWNYVWTMSDKRFSRQ